MKTFTHSLKGNQSKQYILQTALTLFRNQGFATTSMRDIAKVAHLSLGAAYRYFPSKESLVHAYYGWIQGEHERLTEIHTPKNADFSTRFSVLLLQKLELLRHDQKILAALFGALGEPGHPLSVLGTTTHAVRTRSIQQFVALLEGFALPPALQKALGFLLWLAHLGIFLFFVHDNSTDQQHTRRLIALVTQCMRLAQPYVAHPVVRPFLYKAVSILTELGLSSAVS